MPDHQEIRIIDLFEAVMERPYLYTLHGTYQEAVSYLEGYYNGFAHHRIDEGPDTSDDALDLQRYQSFAAWLTERYSLLDAKEALRQLGAQTGQPSEAVLQLYREFKNTA